MPFEYCEYDWLWNDVLEVTISKISRPLKQKPYSYSEKNYFLLS